MQQPHTVHIDDLAAPRYSATAQQIVSAIASIPVDFNEYAVLTAAAEQTGLRHFGDDGFRERLELIVQCMREDADLSPLGRFINFTMLVRFAANRLRVEDMIRRHPEILDIEIRRPLIVAGLARSGTTHLLNLLSADTRLRSLPYWEALEPVPVPGEETSEIENDPRLARCRQTIAVQDEVMPLFQLMFRMQPERAHEEIELLALDFSTMFIETLAILPRWRDYYLSHDQTPHYAYLKRVLQVLQWQRGGERWLLKTPQHLEQFIPLMNVFPDATVVITHRDPVATVASMATMAAYASRMSRDPVRPHQIGHYWADRIETMLRACVRDRERLPTAQSIDVRFHEFMADDMGTVERIYAQAGFDLNATARAAMQDFVRENPRGKEGKVVYDLADFGIDETALRQRLRFYSERFGTRDEPVGATA